MDNFSDYVRAKLKGMKISIKEFAGRLDVGSSMTQRMFNENRWPRDKLPVICNAIQIPVMTEAEVLERFHVAEFFNSRKRNGGGRWAVLEAINPSNKLSDAIVEDRVIETVSELGNRHLMTCITVSVHFAPTNRGERTSDAASAAVIHAADNGCLFAFIIPSQKYIDSVSLRLGANGFISQKRLAGGFNQLCTKYRDMLEAKGVENPDEVAESRLRLFVVDEIDMSHSGHVVSFVLESDGKGKANVPFVIDRGPGTRGRITLRERNELDDKRLVNTLKYAMRVSLSDPKCDAPKRTFIEEAMQRIEREADTCNIVSGCH